MPNSRLQEETTHSEYLKLHNFGLKFRTVDNGKPQKVFFFDWNFMELFKDVPAYFPRNHFLYYIDYTKYLKLHNYGLKLNKYGLKLHTEC